MNHFVAVNYLKSCFTSKNSKKLDFLTTDSSKFYELHGFQLIWFLMLLWYKIFPIVEPNFFGIFLIKYNHIPI